MTDRGCERGGVVLAGLRGGFRSYGGNRTDHFVRGSRSFQFVILSLSLATCYLILVRQWHSLLVQVVDTR